MKMGLFFEEITFITELLGSNFLLPRFLIGGKWDFQWANLLMPISNLDLSQNLRTIELLKNTCVTLPMLY